MYRFCFSRLAPLALTGLLLSASVAFAETGERWQTRMEMSGGEMPVGMPAQTSEVCMPRQTTAQTPGMDDKSCSLLESSKTGSRVRWKARCQDGSTVSGDFTYQGDSAYRGIVSYQGSEGNMQMNISGKRLSGNCQVVTAPKAPVTTGMGQACDLGVATLNGSLFFGSGASCAARRKDFCAHLNNMKPDEYVRVKEEIASGRDPNMQAALKGSGVATMEDAVKGCGTTPEALEARACSNAVNQKQYDFVGKHCPTQSADLKRQHCEGRDYTELIQSADAGLCNALGFNRRGYRKQSSQPSVADVMSTETGDTPDRLIQKGIGQLRGLLGF